MKATLDVQVASLEQVSANGAGHRVDHTAAVGRQFRDDMRPKITKLAREIRMRRSQALEFPGQPSDCDLARR
jgi:hypothetical protein